jgi:hypothetical protein
MPQKIMIRTQEWLIAVGATDITPRAIRAQDYLELICCDCKVPGMVRAGNADSGIKTKGYSYRCQNCSKKIMSEKAKLRTGDKNPFFGKKHSEVSKKQMSDSCKISASKIDPEIRKERSINAYNAAVEKYNGNPMHNADVRQKHHDATHSEKFIKEATERGQLIAQKPEFSKKQSEYSSEYWNEDRDHKTSQQREILLKRFAEYPEWSEKRAKGLREYLSNGERVAATWEKVKKTCIERFGTDNWMQSSDADLRAKSFSSKSELEILSWVRSLGLEASKHRQGGKELDIFIPSLNIGIEYNGLYWHCELHKDQKYHQDKTKYFKEQGIRVIHVFEHIWRDKQPQLKSFLRSALGKNEHKIGARQCEVKEISKEDANEFAKLYHIQGSASSNQLSVGLLYKNELVAVATFGRHHRDSSITVLNRFIGRENYSVIGGLSKIMKFATNNLQRDIITWADNSISEGSGYLKAGWVFEEELPADYFYTDFTDVFSKQSRKKSVVGTPELITEHEHALHDGLFRVYDCGKVRMKFSYL